MKVLPKRFVLSRKPNNYLKQGFSHCGAYSVKAILEAYGLDDKVDPKDYHTNIIGKITGTTVGKNYYVRMFRTRGLRAELKSAYELTGTDKIFLLKKLLNKNTPVMLRIGNGYLAANSYNSVVGKLLGHWITLWGYDDSNESFFVYDSALKEQYRDRNLSVGNTTRTYKEIIRDWNFGLFQFWYWYTTGIGRNFYIEIDNKL